MNEKMMAGLMRAPSPKRYKTVITTVADRENIWLHMSDVWSVWPYGEFASLMYPNATILCVEVHDFCNEYLPKAETLGVSINVFPTKDNDGLIVSPNLLRENLLEELERIE